MLFFKSDTALSCWARTTSTTCRSMAVAVSGEQASEVSPPSYWLLTVSMATMPNSSDMP